MNLHDLVVRAAQRDPDAVAVEAPGEMLTYGELDRFADRYCAALRARGIGPGDRVLLWTGKSAHAVAFMQGALRAGAVYVPVTAANPPVRVARIAEDCTASLIVTDADTRVRAQGDDHPTALVSLAELLAEAPRESGPPIVAAADDPAYILYTSGSTGSPKGVCLSHRNALAFVDWAADLTGLGPDDRLSNHAPFNFDLSVFDLYAAFRAGASVHLVPGELAYAPTGLAAFIRERAITVWYSVPSALALMMREGALLDQAPPPALRVCVFAGEPFAIQQVQELRKAWPQVRLFNWYGPTETNVCTSYEVTDADLARTRPLPIGTAASGDTITLDPATADGAPKSASEGEWAAEGEIVVAGPTVMLGYWGRPPQRGAYRTGDYGKLGSDGNLEYTGRIDHMVKIRGNRVELGEIEAALGSLRQLARVAVVVVGGGLEARLHAVAIPAGPERPSGLAIRRHCSERLPAYMIVDAVHYVDALPLTPNGKTDRAALIAAISEGEI